MCAINIQWYYWNGCCVYHVIDMCSLFCIQVLKDLLAMCYIECKSLAVSKLNVGHNEREGLSKIECGAS
jgi:hypothetical protein